MKKLILISLVAPTILTACTKSINETKKEKTQTVYFRIQDAKSGKVTNIVTVKFK